MEQWVFETGTRVVVIFEGRDAAGKGGTIKRITEHMNPRTTRIVALPKPTERERTEWYFQRYVAELPSGGEIALFDRSWYNRAGIERVLGFCTHQEYYRFLRQCPIFERLLVEDGIILIKYWFSVSDEEQEQRFHKRVTDRMRRWKLSETDLASRTHFVDYSRAKDEMFVHTDIPEAPWFTVEADDKPSARLNCWSFANVSRVCGSTVRRPAAWSASRYSSSSCVRWLCRRKNFLVISLGLYRGRSHSCRPTRVNVSLLCQIDGAARPRRVLRGSRPRLRSSPSQLRFRPSSSRRSSGGR